MRFLVAIRRDKDDCSINITTILVLVFLEALGKDRGKAKAWWAPMGAEIENNVRLGRQTLGFNLVASEKNFGTRSFQGESFLICF